MAIRSTASIMVVRVTAFKWAHGCMDQNQNYVRKYWINNFSIDMRDRYIATVSFLWEQKGKTLKSMEIILGNLGMAVKQIRLTAYVLMMEIKQ